MCKFSVKSVVSVVVASFIAFTSIADFQTATLNGDFAKALEIQDKLTALHDVMFIEPSPGPVKYAAKLLGLCSDEMRLPMTPITEATEIKVKDAMVQARLLD